MPLTATHLPSGLAQRFFGTLELATRWIKAIPIPKTAQPMVATIPPVLSATIGRVPREHQ